MQQAPDGWFYYAVTLVFGGALIFVILKYTGKIDVTLTKVQEAVNDLKTMVSLHEQKLETHDDDINNLKSKVYKVNYQK